VRFRKGHKKQTEETGGTQSQKVHKNVASKKKNPKDEQKETAFQLKNAIKKPEKKRSHRNKGGACIAESIRTQKGGEFSFQDSL